MPFRLLGWFDDLAHFLYSPTCGRWTEPSRWHHHIHLLPYRFVWVVCDHYDRALGVTEDEMYRTG